METTRDKGVVIGGFAGMVSDADPRDLDKNALQLSINASLETPGKIESRRGLQPMIRYGDLKYAHWSPVKPSHAVIRDVLGNPTFIAWESVGGTVGQILAGLAEAATPLSSARNEWKALHNSTRGDLSPSYSKPSITVTSAGEVFVANGYNPMMKWGGRIGTSPSSTVTSKVGNQFLPAGIDAPTAAPTISLSGTAGNLIVGDYLTAYRYKDYEGNPSDLSPLYTASPTVAGNTVSWTVSQPSTAMPSYDRITEIELLRGVVGVAAELYKVTSLPVGTSTYAETLSDDTLRDAEKLIITNDDGSVNANRFGVPPLKPIVTWHQDRMYAAGSIVLSTGTVTVASGASTGTGTSTTFQPSMAGWEMTLDVDGAAETYAVDSFQSSTAFTLGRTCATTFSAVDFALRPGLSERNTIYYSEADEPESWPVAQNNLILQADGTGTYAEDIVSLMSFGPTLYAIKPTIMYRIDSVTQPNLDASILPAALRGVFNHWSWAQADGRAYMMDRLGCYVFDHSKATPIGDAINNYFREGLIDFTNADKFHVSANRRTKVVRFHVALSGKNDASDYPMWAFAYSYRTNAWWIERYPWGVCGAGTFKKSDGSEQYYVFPDGYTPHYESTNACDYLATPVRVQITSISNTVSDGNDYTCRLGIAGIDASYLGCPIAFTSGTGKGVYGIITGEQSTDVYNARLFTIVSPLSLPVAGDEAYLGGVPYEFKTKRYAITESPEGTRREITVWFNPQSTTTMYGDLTADGQLLMESGDLFLLESGDDMLLEDGVLGGTPSAVDNMATFDIRHYLDGRTLPVNADAPRDSNDDQAKLTEGSPDGVISLASTRAGTLNSGVARKQFGPSVLLHDVPSSRLIDVEVRGVAAEERHSFNQFELEGAV